VVVGRRIARTTGTLLLTYRSDEIELHAEARAVLSALPTDAVRRIDLAPLSPRAVEELARRAGQPAEGLHAATGGNAFFVTEVLAAAAGGRADIPASVRELVGARLARLSPPARAAVEIASVAPTHAEPWLLRGALEADPGALDECVATGPRAIAGVDPDPANVDVIREWSIDYFDALHPYSAGGAYVNMMMDEGEDRVRASYRDNYDRLARVKESYDPANLFRVNQNIVPRSTRQ
jgi:Berberine and berberine like